MQLSTRMFKHIRDRQSSRDTIRVFGRAPWSRRQTGFQPSCISALELVKPRRCAS